MQVRNVVRAARWKCRTQKIAIWTPSHNFIRLGPISSQLRHVSTIGKKLVKQQYLPHMFSQYCVLRSSSGWDRFVSLGHPYEFQRVSRLDSVTARYSSSGRQPNFTALNRGRHLYSAGRPSRWALAHILVVFYLAAFDCSITDFDDVRAEIKSLNKLLRNYLCQHTTPVKKLVVFIRQHQLLSCSFKLWQVNRSANCDRFTVTESYLWPPCLADADTIFFTSSFAMTEFYYFCYLMNVTTGSGLLLRYVMRTFVYRE